jgi:hypothetical protein
MSDDKPTHPVVFHGIGTLIASCAIPALGGILYLTAVSSWHSLRAVGNAVTQGRIGWARHWGWTVTAGLLGLTLPIFVIDARKLQTESESPWLLFVSVSLTAAVLCFVLIGLLRIPAGIWRWVRSQVARRAAAREAARRRQDHALAAREQVAAQRRQAEAAVAQRGDGRRRIDARSKCEMAYALYAPEIRDRFPKAAFDHFLQTYMHDSIDVADVERRAVELQGIIEQHRRLSDPGALKKPKSLEDITRWYIDERKRIQGMEVDAEIKSVQLGLLEQRYAELSERFLTTYEP